MTIVSLLDDQARSVGPLLPKFFETVRGVAPSVAPVVRDFAVRRLDDLVATRAPTLVRVAYPFFKRSMARFSRGFGRSRRLSFRGAKKYRRRATPTSRATYRMPVPRSVIKQDHTAITSDTLNSVIQKNVILPARGTGQDDRVSNVIKVLDWRISAVFDKVNNQSPGDVRVVVFKWIQGYVSPTPASVLLDTSTNLNAFLSPYFQQDAKNYKIMWDQVIRFNGVTNTTTNLVVGQNQVTWRHTFRLNQLLTFNGDLATDSDVKYVCVIIPSQVAPVVLGTVYFKQSVRFVDV